MAGTAVVYETGSVKNNAGDANRIAIGSHTHIRGELMTFGHGGSIRIGDYCYVGEQTRIWSGASIEIGNRVLIAHAVNIFDNRTHPLDPVERHEQYKRIISEGFPNEANLDDQPIAIEDDAWIGASSSILRGVRIGKAAIVGVGSVVTKDVPPGAIVAGNPAVIIKHLPGRNES